MQKDLTKGNMFHILLGFSLPYLLSSFLQTFYGLADLFITGQFNGAASISAVSVGSQVMHMVTVVIVALALGPTIAISRAVGAKRPDEIRTAIGNAVTVFLIFAACATLLLLLCTDGIIRILAVPAEAVPQTKAYLTICFIGIPAITAYNVVSSIFRGLGDTKTPMYFIAAAGVVNIGLDWLLIGPLHMGARGAALGTVIAQTISVILALGVLMRRQDEIRLVPSDLRPDGNMIRKFITVGVPIAFQDSVIQISFLIITVIANSRGLEVSAAVGIVEKVIGFLFLVPSAMLSTVSVAASQNAGAGKHDRGRTALRYGILICLIFGMVVFAACQFISPQIVRLFAHDNEPVVRLGGQYLRTYSLDCALAGMHFCFSGYFSAYNKSIYSFIHNVCSVALRVPGAYLASVWYPATLTPMGIAAPLGSLLSVIICVIIYRLRREKDFNH